MKGGQSNYPSARTKWCLSPEVERIISSFALGFCRFLSLFSSTFGSQFVISLALEVGKTFLFLIVSLSRTRARYITTSKVSPGCCPFALSPRRNRNFHPLSRNNNLILYRKLQSGGTFLPFIQTTYSEQLEIEVWSRIRVRQAFSSLLSPV